jgi:hypothetical protein
MWPNHCDGQAQAFEQGWRGHGYSTVPRMVDVRATRLVYSRHCWISRLLSSGLLNVTQIRMAITEIRIGSYELGDAWALLAGSKTEAKKEYANIFAGCAAQSATSRTPARALITWAIFSAISLSIH